MAETAINKNKTGRSPFLSSEDYYKAIILTVVMTQGQTNRPMKQNAGARQRPAHIWKLKTWCRWNGESWAKEKFPSS